MGMAFFHAQDPGRSNTLWCMATHLRVYRHTSGTQWVFKSRSQSCVGMEWVEDLGGDRRRGEYDQNRTCYLRSYKN